MQKGQPFTLEQAMTNLPPGSTPAAPSKAKLSTWLGQHRILSAVLLHGLWKLRWYQTVFILWPMLIVAAWGASPYFMVYVVGMPEPGTAPRYVGTVRFEGELQRTKTGWIPPKYFIQTINGEVEFHCDYLPKKGECSLAPVLGAKPDSSYVYEIGYDSYWGLDYIKFPPLLYRLQERGESVAVSRWRVARLYAHTRYALWFSFLLLMYLYLIWLTYQKSDPIRKLDTDGSSAKLNALESNLLIAENAPSKPSPQAKPRRSFFD
jgi:hypothetical protein